MLSDEEKKAIEECENFLKEKSSSYINYYNDEGNQRTFWFSNLKEVLNLIEKQDKIINEMADFIVHCDIDEDICQYMQDYMQDGGCGDRLECKKMHNRILFKESRNCEWRGLKHDNSKSR